MSIDSRTRSFPFAGANTVDDDDCISNHGTPGSAALLLGTVTTTSATSSLTTYSAPIRGTSSIRFCSESGSKCPSTAADLPLELLTSAKQQSMWGHGLPHMAAWLEEHIAVPEEGTLHELGDAIDTVFAALQERIQQFGPKLIARVFPDIRRMVASRYIAQYGDVGPPLSLSRFEEFCTDLPSAAASEAEHGAAAQHHLARDMLCCSLIDPQERVPADGEATGISKLQSLLESGHITPSGVLSTPELSAARGAGCGGGGAAGGSPTASPQKKKGSCFVRRGPPPPPPPPPIASTPANGGGGGAAGRGRPGCSANPLAAPSGGGGGGVPPLQLVGPAPPSKQTKLKRSSAGRRGVQGAAVRPAVPQLMQGQQGVQLQLQLQGGQHNPFLPRPPRSAEFAGDFCIPLPAPHHRKKAFAVLARRLHGGTVRCTLPRVSFLASSARTSLTHDAVEHFTALLRKGVRIAHLDLEHAIRPDSPQTPLEYCGRERYRRAQDIPQLLDKFPVLEEGKCVDAKPIPAADGGAGAAGPPRRKGWGSGFALPSPGKLMSCLGAGGADSGAEPEITEEVCQDAMAAILLGLQRAAQFCEAFSGLTLPRVSGLGMSLTTPRVVAGLCTVLSGCDLVTLSLRGAGLCKRRTPGKLASGLSATHFEQLCNAFGQCTSLEHFDISDNYLGDALGASVVSGLLRGASESGTPLRHLAMGHNCLGDASAVKLRALVASVSLVRLDISYNAIVGDAFTGIVSALRVRRSLQRLDFDHNVSSKGTRLTDQQLHLASATIRDSPDPQLVLQVLANLSLEVSRHHLAGSPAALGASGGNGAAVASGGDGGGGRK